MNSIIEDFVNIKKENIDLEARLNVVETENKVLREEVERLKKQLEFPEPEWEDDDFTHPLLGVNAFGSIETFCPVTWEHMGVSYKTREKAVQAVRSSLLNRWNEIHGITEEVRG